MKRQAFLSAIALLQLAACGDATEPTRKVAEDTFQEGALAQYTAYSDGGNPWSLGTGVLRGDGLGLQSVLIRNGASVRDGWVETVADSVDDGGLVLRFSDKENYYLLAIRDDMAPFPFGRDNLEIYQKSGPGQAGFRSLWVQNINWPRGELRTIRFEAVGDSLKVHVNGSRVGALHSGSTMPGTGFGLRHYGGSQGWITRYRVLRWASM